MTDGGKTALKMGDLLIRGCRVYDPASGADGCPRDLLIRDGRIAPADEAPTPGTPVLEADGLAAAPGLVDMHVHLRDPGFTHKEDILSGCCAAAAGGVTALAPMPNTDPVADSPDILRYILEKAHPTGVRVFPIAAATIGQQGETPVDYSALRAAGAVAFSDDGRPVESAAVMLAAMRGAAAAGSFVISHCEVRELSRDGVVNEGEISRLLGVPGIPNAAEEAQVARDIGLAEAGGVHVHIAHISTAGSAALIRAAKKRGVPVTCETCPHYFSLDESLLRARDADYRMNPPLRTRCDVEAIRDALKDGTVDAIVTDHAPHAAAEKTDFMSAPNGIVGLETSLAAGITFLVRPGFLTLSELIGKMSLSPARLLGIDAGTLQPGTRGGVVLFDPDEAWTVEPSALRSKSKNTAFKGQKLFGRVHYTITNGNIIYDINK